MLCNLRKHTFTQNNSGKRCTNIDNNSVASAITHKHNNFTNIFCIFYKLNAISLMEHVRRSKVPRIVAYLTITANHHSQQVQ